MTDEINAGDDSDRLFVYWDLNGAQNDQSISPNAITVEIPEDIEALRKTDLAAAKVWRAHTREKLQPLLEQGWTIKAMQDRIHLLVEPPK
jgi:predicted GNAT superfamily acetyltransferase